MQYFKDIKGDVYGYDETVESQLPYIQKAIDAGWTDITGSWPPGPTQKETQSELSWAVTSALNNGAQKWGYDTIESGVSYVTSTNTQYAAEANALNTWRDTVWEWAIPALEKATFGETTEQFLAKMPAMPSKPVK
jgi:hypothetical protein